MKSMKKAKYYYKDGTSSGELDYSKIIHRTDGPAVEHANGTRFWYVDDKRHRTDGPAMEYADGTRFWYVNDKRHRVDGPAMEYVGGSKLWYVDDKLHRIDGPAMEYIDWSSEWYVDDKRYSEKEFKALIEEVESLSEALKLIDPREWVRKEGR